jgi:transposase-like protein
MKRKNFSEAQIVSILQMQESGRSVKEICREHGIYTQAKCYRMEW